MSWLLRGGDVLAALEDKRPGWPATIQGALILRRPVLIHTFGATAALDLASCSPIALDDGTAGLTVRRIGCIKPRRVAAPHLGPGVVVAAPSGSFERWKLQVGDCLEIRVA